MSNSSSLGSCLEFLEGTTTVLHHFQLFSQEKLLEEHAAPLPPLFSFSFCERYSRWQLASLWTGIVSIISLWQSDKNGKNYRKPEITDLRFFLPSFCPRVGCCLQDVCVRRLCRVRMQIKAVQWCSYPGKSKWMDKRFGQFVHRLLMLWSMTTYKCPPLSTVVSLKLDL